MTITPHSYYRDRAQSRRMDWIRRKEYNRKTGRTPPIQWADAPRVIEWERVR